MILPIGGTFNHEFSTRNTTGALADATSTGGVLVVNGTNTAVTVTITDIGTGRYAVSVSLAGRAAGDRCHVRISATCDGVTDEGIVGEFVIGPVGADVRAINGDSTAAGNLELAYDGTGYTGGTTPQIVQVGSYTTGSGPADMILATPAYKLSTDFNGNVTVASAMSASDVWGYSTREITGGSVSSVSNTVSATVTGMHPNVLTASALATDAVTEIVTAVWNALTSGMSTAGSISKRIIDCLTGDIFTRLGAPAGASTAADVAAMKADTAAIKSKTDNLPASPAAVGAAMTLTAGERTTLAGVVWAALASGLTTAGSIGKRLVDFVTGDIFGRLGAPAGASVSADVAAAKSDTTAIKTKTDNLPASPAASGEYTAAIADIPTVAEFEARSLPAADYTVVGDLSGLSTLDAAGVRAALGMASANLDTQIGTLATGASIVTLGGYVDTEVASILAIVNSGTHGNAALLTAIGGVSAGSGLTAQQTRDAMALALGSGVVAASGSIDSLISGISGGASGDGDTPVDHNTGGTDALRYTLGGDGADNVVIKAYPKSEYDAGTRTLRGTAYTGPDGRWLSPLMLNAGVAYTLVASIPGVTEAAVTEITP